MAKILYVDDEADIREIACLSLELDADLIIKATASGAEALVTAHQWQPDLVVLDVMMPEMDGPTTLAALHQNAQTAHIPVIFITARAQKGEAERLRALGALGVLTKPFDPMTLAAEVKAFLQ